MFVCLDTYTTSVCVCLHVQQVEGVLLCSAVTWAPFPPQALFLRMDACMLLYAASQQWQKHPPSLLPAPVALFLTIHILLFAGRPGFLCDRDWWGLESIFCLTHLLLHLLFSISMLIYTGVFWPSESAACDCALGLFSMAVSYGEWTESLTIITVYCRGLVYKTVGVVLALYSTQTGVHLFRWSSVAFM